MPNDAQISRQQESQSPSSDAGHAGNAAAMPEEERRDYNPGPISLAHAMTADENDRMQSKPVPTADSAGHDPDDSELMVADDVTDIDGSVELPDAAAHENLTNRDESPEESSDDALHAVPAAQEPESDETRQEEQQLQSDAGSTDTDDPGQEGDFGEEKIKHIVEAALLAAGKPLSIDRLLTLFLDEEQPDRKAIGHVLESLQQEYEGRGIEVREVSTGWRIQVRKEYAPWVSRLWEEKPGRYSRALLETLSLIAYRQPITRGEIEDVRGVAVSTNIIKTLLERDWVRVVGHRDVPGRPSLYATTREFLDYFGLKSLDELPTLAEIKELDDLNPSLDLPDPEAKTSEEPQEAVSEVMDDTAMDSDAGGFAHDDAESHQHEESEPETSGNDELAETQDERLH